MLRRKCVSQNTAVAHWTSIVNINSPQSFVDTGHHVNEVLRESHAVVTHQRQRRQRHCRCSASLRSFLRGTSDRLRGVYGGVIGIDAFAVLFTKVNAIAKYETVLSNLKISAENDLPLLKKPHRKESDTTLRCISRSWRRLHPQWFCYVSGPSVGKRRSIVLELTVFGNVPSDQRTLHTHDTFIQGNILVIVLDLTGFKRGPLFSTSYPNSK